MTNPREMSRSAEDHVRELDPTLFCTTVSCSFPESQGSGHKFQRNLEIAASGQETCLSYILDKLPVVLVPESVILLHRPKQQSMTRLDESVGSGQHRTIAPLLGISVFRQRVACRSCQASGKGCRGGLNRPTKCSWSCNTHREGFLLFARRLGEKMQRTGSAGRRLRNILGPISHLLVLGLQAGQMELGPINAGTVGQFGLSRPAVVH